MDYTQKQQISFFLLNKPGELNKLLGGITKADVNLVAISVADADPESVVRIVTENNIEDLEERLEQLGLEHFEINEVFAFELKGEAGKLMEITSALAARNVNILNLYGSEGNDSKAMLILHPDKGEVTQSVLDAL
jgi:hypothetical protein